MKVMHMARGWLWGIAVIVLAACSTLSGRQGQIATYEASLRQEADWLWNNMNFCRTNFSPTADQCEARIFSHKPVPLTGDQRKADPASAGLVDHLDYAATLIGQARDSWEQFCSGRRSASYTVTFLESRLLPTYESLNYVRVTLNPQQPTPQPGSA